MTSTFSPSLGIELMATGDQNGVWGVTNNSNLGTLIEQGITGVLSVAQGDTTLTLTATQGASNQARNAVVNLTGAMTGDHDVIVPTANKLYLIKNSTTGGHNTTIKTVAGTGIAVLPGTNRWVYCDGTNVVDGQNNLQTLSLTALSPATTDTLALGTTSLMWSDLFLASGGVVNWNNGDVTITHAANTLTFGGASSGYAFTGGPVVPATNDASALGTTTLQWSDLFLASGGVLNWANGDVNITHVASNSLIFSGASAGYAFDASVIPNINDGGALGSASFEWSDLFLASGGVINWSNGNVTLTHSADNLSTSARLNLNQSASGFRLVMTSLEVTGIGWYTQADTTGLRVAAQFANSSGSVVGSITQTNSATTFLTSSDPRLKDRVQDLPASGVYIDSLRPVEWLWKGDNSYGAGFLSTEFSAVNPRAVSGEEDAVDVNGEPVYQQLDASTPETIAHIVAELQSLRKRVAALEE